MPVRRKNKTSRRKRVRAGLSRIRQSPKARFVGRNSKNLIIGSVLLNATSRLIGSQTARAGIYAQPLNLAIAGTVGKFIGAGQADLTSAGIKIAGSRFITTQLEPRLMGLSNRNTTQGGGT